MSVDTARAGTVDTGRPGTARLIWIQLRHANRGFWRTPIAAFFTLIFPLIFLLLIGTLFGGEQVGPPGDEVPAAQFITPAIAAFAAVTASFTALATGLVIDREEGVLKRVRGTPTPPWMFLVARIGSTVWLALLSTVLMILVGVALFGVEIIWRTLPAAFVTFAVGVGSFAALGLAVVALVPSQSATSAVTNAVIIPLAFISDVFIQASLPAWLETIGWLFPLKHFANAMIDTFDPFLDGAQFSWDHLAVMAAWGVAGGIVALRWFRWDAQGGRRTRRGGRDVADEPTDGSEATGSTVALRPVERGDRPSVGALAWLQTRYAFAAFLRNPSSAFFIVVFPVVLLLLLPLVFDDAPLESRGGIPLTQLLAPVLAVFGAATAAYSDFSQRVASARDRGILKRIHGTPLPLWAFMAGRIGSAIGVALASLVITVGVGMVVWGVELVPRALPGLLVAVFLGIACFAALGLAIAAVAPSAEAVPTIANATLLPLAFVSDIFIITDGQMPTWMETIGDVFPLKHFANAVADAVNPTIPGAGFSFDHIAVMTVWLVVGVAVAARFWTWQPRGRAE